MKEKIIKICQDLSLENVRFQEKSFTIYLGNILNTDREGNTYILLETYVEIPYECTARKCKLHRGLVEEREFNGVEEYSGFVHYHGNAGPAHYGFCWGECGVDTLLNTIIAENNITEDDILNLIIKFERYLSFSNHGTKGDYKKLDLESYAHEYSTKILQTVEINNVIYPAVIERLTTFTTELGVDYEGEMEILKELPNYKFNYGDTVIIPKKVRFPKKKETVIQKKYHPIDILIINNKLISDIKRKLSYEINNRKRIDEKDLLYKLTNIPHRMDGDVYIQNFR